MAPRETEETDEMHNMYVETNHDRASTSVSDEEAPLPVDADNVSQTTSDMSEGVSDDDVEVNQGLFSCACGKKPNELPWLTCRIRTFSVVLFILALILTLTVALELTCGAYFSKAMAIIGYFSIAVTVGASAQTFCHVGLMRRGTSNVKITLSIVLHSTSMILHLCMVTLAMYYSAAEPVCRPIDSQGDVISVNATTPPGGPNCYKDFYSRCFKLLAGIVAIGTLDIIVGVMMLEKLYKVRRRN